MVSRSDDHVRVGRVDGKLYYIHGNAMPPPGFTEVEPMLDFAPPKKSWTPEKAARKQKVSSDWYKRECVRAGNLSRMENKIKETYMYDKVIVNDPLGEFTERIKEAVMEVKEMVRGQPDFQSQYILEVLGEYIEALRDEFGLSKEEIQPIASKAYEEAQKFSGYDDDFVVESKDGI